jgi:epsin
MDRLEALGNTISQITLYDIKSMYNQVRKIPPTSLTSLLKMTQAKNAVLNVSEMEAKVQEATNDEAWWVATASISSYHYLNTSKGERVQP